MLTVIALAWSGGVLFLGDTGTGGVPQQQVSAAMAAFCRDNPCDAVALLGDNFYPDGVSSTTDDQWDRKFEGPYAVIKLPFHPALGNHDHRGNVQAQLDYTSERWSMPAATYTWTMGEVEFFVLDTDVFDEDQAKWLKKRLRRSKATWKVVYGHHPVYSHGEHGDTPELVADLQPILARYADLYLAGHDHNLEAIDTPTDDVLYLVSGGGGAPLRTVTTGDTTLYVGAVHGFGHLRIEDDKLVVSLRDVEGNVLFERELPAQ